MANKPDVEKYALDSNDQETYRLREQHAICKAAMNGILVLAPIGLSKGGLASSTQARLTLPPDYCWVCRAYPARNAVFGLCGNAAPGCWVQLVEPEQHAGQNDEPYRERFAQVIQEVLRAIGMQEAYAPKLKGLLEEAGLEDVQQRKFDLLLGSNHPDPALTGKGIRSTGIAIGFFIHLVETLSERIKTMLTETELDSIADNLRKALKERGRNSPFRVVLGRKPSR